MLNKNYKLGLTHTFLKQISEACVHAEAADFPKPELVFFNQALAESFSARFSENNDELACLLSGQCLSSDAKPIAQAYAGHQFGHFNPQLGDGRAMILGEFTDQQGKRFEIDLKGSGPTPFSRGGDGKAGMGPMLREVLIAEAMNALGVATTRSLAVVSTGEQVYRNPPQPGAVLARTASSHVRIGTFQFFAARDQYDVIEKLVNFCIERHYPHLKSSASPALDLLQAAIKSQAQLIGKWMGLGFIHGVMNTDNMLVGAETIDYGPCAFMDTYDPNTVFSSIDKNSRYAYSNQAGVAQWNLSRFAETLLPLIDDDKEQAIELATKAVQAFMDKYENEYRQVMSNKLGLSKTSEHDEIDELLELWTTMLFEQKVDWTLSHYHLTHYLLNGNKALFSLFKDESMLNEWLLKRKELNASDLSIMKNSNPAVIPRNHLVEEALHAASFENNFSLFETLLEHLLTPYNWPDDVKYTQAASTEFTDEFVTFCGT